MARFEVLETRIEGNAAVLKFRCFACGTVEVIQTDTTPGSRKCPSCSAPYWLYDTAAGLNCARIITAIYAISQHTKITWYSSGIDSMDVFSRGAGNMLQTQIGGVGPGGGTLMAV